MLKKTGLPARYGPTGTLFQAFPEFIEPKTLHLQHSACTGSKAVGKGPQTPLHPQTGPRYPLAQQGAAHLHILPLPVKDSAGTTAYLVTESLQTGIEPCRTVGQKSRHRRRRLQRKGGDISTTLWSLSCPNPAITGSGNCAIWKLSR